MNTGLFRASLNQGIQLLKTAKLFEQKNAIVDYSTFECSKIRGLDYVEQWNTIYKNRWFDVRLTNGALLQFRNDSQGKECSLSYQFIECPFAIKPYQEWIMSLGGNFTKDKWALWDEYENYTIEAPVKSAFTPIRYDYDSSENKYTEGAHPHSHIHFGIKNEVRVGTTKLWAPQTFVMFILRQCFKNEWLKLVLNKKADVWGNCIRNNLEPSPKSLGSRIDRMEAVLY